MATRTFAVAFLGGAAAGALLLYAATHRHRPDADAEGVTASTSSMAAFRLGSVSAESRLAAAESKPRRRQRGSKRRPDAAMDAFYSAANVANCYKHVPDATLQKFAKGAFVPAAVCVLNVNSDWNVGALMRTAALLKFEAFAVVGRAKFDTRGCVGAMNYIRLIKRRAIGSDADVADARSFVSEPTVNVAAFRAFLDEHGYTPVFVEQSGELLGQLSWGLAHSRLPEGRTFVFVFGNETTGVPPEVLAVRKDYAGSFVLTLEQYSVMKSLNVAVSAGIVLWSAAEYHAGRARARVGVV